MVFACFLFGVATGIRIVRTVAMRTSVVSGYVSGRGLKGFGYGRWDVCGRGVDFR